MTRGAGRRVGGWGMVAGAILVAAGTWVLTDAAYKVQRQAAQLDPSKSRLAATGEQGAMAVFIAAMGLLLVLIFGITFLVGSARARRAMPQVERAPGIAAGVSGILVLACLLFALLAPQGPLQVTAATLSGGGPDAVEVRKYEGTLTAATVGGQTNAENVHAIDLVAKTGSIRLRLGSQGSGVPAAVAIAILEAPDGQGGWKEIARTPATNDATVDVPTATYVGNLQARVRMADNSAGQVGYVLAFSFTPVD